MIFGGPLQLADKPVELGGHTKFALAALLRVALPAAVAIPMHADTHRHHLRRYNIDDTMTMDLPIAVLVRAVSITVACRCEDFAKFPVNPRHYAIRVCSRPHRRNAVME